MSLLRRIYYTLGPLQRRWVRRLFFLPSDIFDAVLKRRAPLVPPKGMIFTGQGDFAATGDTLLKNLVDTCALKPDHHILDVGCGIGRLARPLTAFLNEDGTYEGFDVVEDGIKWCRKNYHAYPNFNFSFTPLKNDLYNLNTKQTADTFQFPYPDQFFDLVVLTSVFTHMQMEEVRNYFLEIGRVLKPGGHCFATFFIINKETETYLDKSRNPFFPYRFRHYFLHDPRVRDANIAYRHEIIVGMATAAELSVDQFYPGWWAGKSQNACMNFQDVLVLKTLT